jgi:FMN phosphatase YigB (HAD superfamily)
MSRAIIFDWGDTLMRDDPDLPGPMAHWPTVELVAGVKDALEALDPALVRCVASNAGASDAELMGQALDRVGIRTYFDHLFTSKELGAAKPDPRFFRAIADRLGLAPSECVMVGNDYTKDIAGAKAVGMCTVWLHGAGSTEAEQADFIIRTMAELPAVIRSVSPTPGSAGAAPVAE